MIKILVIEDEDILRGEVTAWLQLEGYEVLCAADGQEGVEAAFKMRPELIVCDITMPVLDGYGVLVELRSNPATTTTPFIFMTARVAHEDIRRGMSLGADDYVTKPFTRVELLEAIQARLRKKELQNQELHKEMALLDQLVTQEREQRLLKVKFVAMLSHDFRNSLTGIMTSHGLLRDYADRLDAARRRYHLDRIEAYVNQLTQMLDDTMLIAKIETQSLTFAPERLNLTQFLEHIVHEFQSIYSATHVLHFACDGVHTINFDPRLVRQIVSNLLSNAIKYSPSGGEVRVSLQHDTNFCILEVTDQGIGILEEDQARLFNPFQRGANVGSIAGTGLGLAIVKQAAELHHGVLDMVSQSGQGTTMIVKLPV